MQVVMRPTTQLSSIVITRQVASMIVINNGYNDKRDLFRHDDLWGVTFGPFIRFSQRVYQFLGISLSYWWQPRHELYVKQIYVHRSKLVRRTHPAYVLHVQRDANTNLSSILSVNSHNLRLTAILVDKQTRLLWRLWFLGRIVITTPPSLIQWRRLSEF
jgi:hypothetical protein